MPQPLSQPTPTQARIAQLAEAMADANPDAAEELARHLAHQAAERKRVRGFGVAIRWNLITQQIEITKGEI